MKIKSIAANQTEITLANGDVVFFSYETPVAAFVYGKGIVKTSQKHNNTITRHINKFIQRTAPRATITQAPESFFQSLLCRFFPDEHWGDYVMLKIDIDTGKILNWQKPTEKDLAIFK